EDENVVHVAGRVDPISDIEVINTELALADLASAEKALQRHQKTARAGDKEAIKMVALLEKLIPVLNEARPIRSIGLDEDDLALIKSFCFITAKRCMYVANVKEDGFKNNPHLAAVKQSAEAKNAPVVAVCAEVEAEIAEPDDEDKSVFLADMGMDEPELNRVIRAAYSLLGLQTYCTAGVKE